MHSDDNFWQVTPGGLVSKPGNRFAQRQTTLTESWASCAGVPDWSLLSPSSDKSIAATVLDVSSSETDDGPDDAASGRKRKYFICEQSSSSQRNDEGTKLDRESIPGIAHGLRAGCSSEPTKRVRTEKGEGREFGCNSSAQSRGWSEQRTESMAPTRCGCSNGEYGGGHGRTYGRDGDEHRSNRGSDKRHREQGWATGAGSCSISSRSGENKGGTCLSPDRL